MLWPLDNQVTMLNVLVTLQRDKRHDTKLFDIIYTHNLVKNKHNFDNFAGTFENPKI